jgi:hypothetical protein
MTQMTRICEGGDGRPDGRPAEHASMGAAE